MENILWKRGIVFGIIVLFIGASVIPGISGNIRESIKVEDVKDFETECMNDIYQTNDEMFIPSLGKEHTQPISGTIYIRPDGSVEGTDKIQRDGDVYTFIDDIYQSICVQRDNIIIDGDGYTLDGNWSHNWGFYLDFATNVTIKNTNIQHWGWTAIVLATYPPSSATIYGNNITNNSDAIWIQWTSNTSVYGNIITDNNGIGVKVVESSNINVSGNIITNNNKGIVLSISSNNVLRNNIMVGNVYNFDVWGTAFSHFIQDIDTSNIIDWKPIYYLINQDTLTINPSTYPDIGYLALIDSANIIVEGLELKNNGQGVLFAYTTNSQITNNDMINNEEGIYLSNSPNNNISGNTITNSYYYGVKHHESPFNTILGNIITNNQNGISLGGYNNNVSKNIITNNQGDGISLGGYNNNVSKNIITNNQNGISLGGYNNNVSKNIITNNQNGIGFVFSSNNIVSRNYITNSSFGVFFYMTSENNTFFENNFINNTQQVFFFMSDSANTWDNGYPRGGNYWDDYTGVDNFSGPDQNITGIDGIGDTPYNISGGSNQDLYPFMNPNGWLPKISDVTITTSDPLDTEPGFGWENFSCTVTDNIAVDEVKLVITGDTTTEYPMTKSDDNYYCNITLTIADEYNYHIWANDTNRNYNTSASQPFDLPLNEDVNEDGSVGFVDIMMVAGMWNALGPNGWDRADVDNNGEVGFVDVMMVAGQWGQEW